MVNDGSTYAPIHTPFFIIYTIVSIVFIVLQVRFITIVQWCKELVKLPSYRIAQHSSIACTINIITQLIAVLATFSSANMNETVNWVNGAFFQGAWAAEYPMIFILAAYRLIAVALPHSVDRIFTLKLSYVLVALCWCFGVFNTALCLSGGVRSVWIPTEPGFAFTGNTFIAVFMYNMDFYFGEFVICASLICYVSLFILVIVRRETMKTLKLQGPLILHFGTIFLMTAVILFLWHNPPSTSIIYGHFFNLMVLLRFCISPVLALITNKVVRQRFLHMRRVSAEPMAFTMTSRRKNPTL
ncbi:hypothetical protein V3C99_011028 [Haemonchus contortus]